MAKVRSYTYEKVEKVEIELAPGVWVVTPSLCFIAQGAAVIDEFVPRIIKYIKDNKIECECKIVFNDIEIGISAESNAEDVINEYLNLYKLSC